MSRLFAAGLSSLLVTMPTIAHAHEGAGIFHLLNEPHHGFWMIGAFAALAVAGLTGVWFSRSARGRARHAERVQRR